MLVTSGLEPAPFYQNWLTHSGVNAQSAVAIEVGVHLTSIYYLIVVDGLDATSLRTAEHIARRIVMTFKAVKKCPKAPDFKGLETYTEHILDPNSGVKVGDFDKYVAERKKTEPVIMKSTRMAREEEDTEDKRVKPTTEDPTHTGERVRKPKPKKEAEN
jgi:hypothetical protein